MLSRYRVATQHQAERLALNLLRLGAHSGASANATPFWILAQIATRNHGFIILEPDAPFLSADEVVLLGHIAIGQRQWDRPHDGLPADLRYHLAGSAAELTGRSLRLPYLAIQRLEFLKTVSAADIGPLKATGLPAGGRGAASVSSFGRRR